MQNILLFFIILGLKAQPMIRHIDPNSQPEVGNAIANDPSAKDPNAQASKTCQTGAAEVAAACSASSQSPAVSPQSPAILLEKVSLDEVTDPVTDEVEPWYPIGCTPVTDDKHQEVVAQAYASATDSDNNQAAAAKPKKKVTFKIGSDEQFLTEDDDQPLTVEFIKNAFTELKNKLDKFIMDLENDKLTNKKIAKKIAAFKKKFLNPEKEIKDWFNVPSLYDCTDDRDTVKIQAKYTALNILLEFFAANPCLTCGIDSDNDLIYGDIKAYRSRENRQILFLNNSNFDITDNKDLQVFLNSRKRR